MIVSISLWLLGLVIYSLFCIFYLIFFHILLLKNIKSYIYILCFYYFFILDWLARIHQPSWGRQNKKRNAGKAPVNLWNTWRPPESGKQTS